MGKPIDKNQEAKKRRKSRTLSFTVSEEELQRYHALTTEQKRLIKAVVKLLIYNPQLLDEPEYLYKLLTKKAISPYVCPLCLTPFSSSISLKLHLRYAEHTNECPICHKRFTSVDATLDHVCKKHGICVS